MKLFFGEVFPEVIINEDEQTHILKVLRMKQGETLFVTDGKGNLAEGHIILRGKKVDLEVINIKENLPDFNPKLHIAIAPTKNLDRIEFFVEKAVEMGISEITFLQTENSERKHFNTDKIEKKAISASKQSLRFHFPKINELSKLVDFLTAVDPSTTYVAHCNEKLERIDLKLLNQAENFSGKNLTILIGPEGDFSEKEIELLAQKNIKAISLGNQRLRTETAGIFVAAWNYGLMEN